MSMVNFRLMTYADIEAIVELENESFTVPWGREAFESELTGNPLAHYIVMVKNDAIIGYAGMWLILDEAHIMNVAVASAHRGKGYGKALMQHMLEFAAANGAERITLEVRRSNTVARNLYEKLGFIEQGVRPGYYSDNGEDALILWRDKLNQLKL